VNSSGLTQSADLMSAGSWPKKEEVVASRLNSYDFVARIMEIYKEPRSGRGVRFGTNKKDFETVKKETALIREERFSSAPILERLIGFIK